MVSTKPLLVSRQLGRWAWVPGAQLLQQTFPQEPVGPRDKGGGSAKPGEVSWRADLTPVSLRAHCAARC